MKQTLESAAINELFFSYACASRNISFAGLVYDRNAMLNMFRKGADWQAKQSPWINVKERLPEYPCWVLVTGKEYKYRILFYCGGKFYTDKSLTSYDGSVLFWIPIPSLDKDL